MPDLPHPKARPHPSAALASDRLKLPGSGSRLAALPRESQTSVSDTPPGTPPETPPGPPAAPRDPAAPAYAELCAMSNFSFLRGASHPDELVTRAKELGYAAIALTDLNTLAGVVRAHVAAKAASLPLVIGARIDLDAGTEGVKSEGVKVSRCQGVKSEGVEVSRCQGVKPEEDSHTSPPSASSSSSLVTSTPRHLDTFFSPSLDTSTPRHLDTSPTSSFLLFPLSREGYANLCSLLTRGKRRAPKGHCHLTLHDVLELHADLACVVLPPQAPLALMDERFIELLEGLRRVFGADDRLSLAAMRRFGPDDAAHIALLSRIAAHTAVPLAAVGDVYYHTPDRRDLQDVLTCIRTGVRLAEAGSLLLPSDQHHLKPPEEMARLFAACPGAIQRSIDIALRSASGFSLDMLKYEYPEEACPQGTTPMQRLKDLVWKGVVEEKAEGIEAEGVEVSRCQGVKAEGVEVSRCQGVKSEEDSRVEASSSSSSSSSLDTSSPRHLDTFLSSPSPRHLDTFSPPSLLDRISSELRIIEELGYAKYFLTCHEIVAFARSRGILCQGRGAAANSAVCFYLGITSVDPTRIDTLFERFISKERSEPPDIDIDFEHERREEVIQHIYERYGRDRAALVCEVISYRGRSAVRDVGKALGLSLDCVDRLAKQLDWWHAGPPTREQVAAQGLDPDDPTIANVLRLTNQLLGFPRHLSQHVGGFVLTQRPLSQTVPIENARMKDRTIIEWDKDDIDALGMLKIDILGLGMLTAVRRALEMVSRWEHAEGVKVSRCRGVEAEGVEVSRCQGVKSEKDSRVEASSSSSSSSLDTSTPRHLDTFPVPSEASTHAQERTDGPHQFVPRSACVAEEQAVGQAHLHRNQGDAQIGDLRPYRPDAAGGDLDPVEHRRGVQPQDTPGICPRPADRQRFPCRARDSVGDRNRTGLDAHERGDHRSAHGDRSHALCAHPQARDKPTSINSLDTPTPSSHLPSTPRHLDTSTPSSRLPSTPRHLDTSTPSGSAPFRLLRSLPPEDPLVYDMICAADTVGVFQIESRAQMSMLPRLKPRCFYDLVIEVAIVRPGPIQGDMVHPYLRRRDGLEPVDFPSEAVRSVLGKTLGVPLFQEQAMRLSIVAAGFTPGEADQLRRAMAAWKKRGDVMQRFGEKIKSGMVARGYTEDFATRVFSQLKGFSEYGFPESHAASFALIVYASAWLKRYHPAAFAAALINSQPMGFYAPAQIVSDAQNHGVEIRPIDINKSGWECSIEGPEQGQRDINAEGQRDTGTQGQREAELSRRIPSVPLSLCPSVPSLRLGLLMVHGLGEHEGRIIERAVRERGPFRDVASLWRASSAKVATLRALARADAFASMGLSRREALWQVQALRDEELPLFDMAESEAARQRCSEAGKEEDAATRQASSPPLSPCPSVPLSLLPPPSPDEDVALDYIATGLSLRAHPISFVRAALARRGSIASGTLRDPDRTAHGTDVLVAGIVLCRQRPGTANGVVFITIEDEEGSMNLIVRPKIYERDRKAARHGACLAVWGRVERKGIVVHVMARKIVELSRLVQARHEPAQMSRDFR